MQTYTVLEISETQGVLFTHKGLSDQELISLVKEQKLPAKKKRFIFRTMRQGRSFQVAEGRTLSVIPQETPRRVK